MDGEAESMNGSVKAKALSSEEPALRNDDQLIALIEKLLAKGLDELWDALTPEERRRVFPSLIVEHISSTY